MTDISVIIVNHNTKDLCQQTIKSVRQTTHCASYEIIVVDNSIDHTQVYTDEYGACVYSDVPNNGFGHGCNFGAQRARGRYLLFLNSDTVLHDAVLDRCMLYLNAHSDVGALGIKTLLSDGTFDHGCKRGFPTPINALYYFLGFDIRYPQNKKFGGYRLAYLNENATNDVDSVSGSFLMMPLDLYQSLGGFDEVFFMYGEDLDLCYRIKEKGYRVVYYADVSMLHLKGQSGLSSKNKFVLYHFHHSMLLFYDKHYKKKYPVMLTWLVHSAVRLKYWFSLWRIDNSQGRSND